MREAAGGSEFSYSFTELLKEFMVDHVWHRGSRLILRRTAPHEPPFAERRTNDIFRMETVRSGLGYLDNDVAAFEIGHELIRIDRIVLRRYSAPHWQIG